MQLQSMAESAEKCRARNGAALLKSPDGALTIGRDAGHQATARPLTIPES